MHRSAHLSVLPSAEPLLSFRSTLRRHGLAVTRRPIETLQINLGKRCNQACHHCHVEAGPKRTELMEAVTVERILELVEAAPTVRTVDITGGAPELNPHFRYLVYSARRMGKTVIDCCNLTVLWEQQVWVVASLPCYLKENVERQRGQGVFDRSIRALQKLNALGYGQEGSGLVLDLVYNPAGAFLPPAQAQLEAQYKRELGERFGIQLNRLYALTNMPIKRFLHQLEREGRYDDYMQLLVQAFNPEAALGVMCRDLVSVSWEGRLYDCDFNQMLELPLGRRPRTIWAIAALAELERKPIAFDEHCYGCTVGAGSSCGGVLT